MLYRNVSDARRVFADLQNADGSTVELDPGETVELDVELDEAPAHLELVPERAAKPSSKAKAEPNPEPAEPVESKE